MNTKKIKFKGTQSTTTYPVVSSNATMYRLITDTVRSTLHASIDKGLAVVLLSTSIIIFRLLYVEEWLYRSGSPCSGSTWPGQHARYLTIASGDSSAPFPLPLMDWPLETRRWSRGAVELWSRNGDRARVRVDGRCGRGMGSGGRWVGAFWVLMMLDGCFRWNEVVLGLFCMRCEIIEIFMFEDESSLRLRNFYARPHFCHMLQTNKMKCRFYRVKMLPYCSENVIVSFWKRIEFHS